MVLDSHRSKADVFLLPMAQRMQHISPNTLSWMAFVCAVLAGINFWFGSVVGLIFALLFLMLNALLDALDGKVALITGKASMKGDFLDHVLDRYADIFIVGGIMFSGVHNSIIAFFALLGILMTSYLGTQAMAVGAGRDYGGIMGRADRLVILMLATIIQLVAYPFGIQTVDFGVTFLTFIDAALIIIAVGGHLTAIQRGIRTWKKI